MRFMWQNSKNDFVSVLKKTKIFEEGWSFFHFKGGVHMGGLAEKWIVNRGFNFSELNCLLVFSFS